MHTGVLYTASATQSFCSISDDMRHGPSAIWAHLNPVIEKAQEQFPGVNTVHFFSDGPTTQYRSTNNFYLYSKYMSAHNFAHSSWNFTEAGHGKSSADGVGGLLKRTADKLVCQGNDIQNAESLYRVLSKQNLNVWLFYVPRDEISKVDETLPTNLKTIEGTMQIHQLIWDSATPTSIALKLLSCFCKFPGECRCYIPSKKDRHDFPEHLQVISNDINLQNHTSDSEAKSPQPAPVSEPTETRDETPDFESARESMCTEASELLDFDADPGNVGKWCVIKYDGDAFPGIIQDIDEESVEVKCMCKVGMNRFFWPRLEDCIWYPWADVLGLIQPPKPVTKRHVQVSPKTWEAILNRL